MPERTPLTLQEDIADAYLRYYDTAYWLRDPDLRAERRELLQADGVIASEPLIEPVIPYDSTESIAEVCASVGFDGGVADALGHMLFTRGEQQEDGSFRLRGHQADALRVSLAPAGAEVRNAVVTPGTGSGKTESFLLPVLARILAEVFASAPAPGDASLVGGWRLLAAGEARGRPCRRGTRDGPLSDERACRRSNRSLASGGCPCSEGRGWPLGLLREVHRGDRGIWAVSYRDVEGARSTHRRRATRYVP